MRFSFLVSLVITLAFAGVYWYESGAYQCPVPLAYRLGTLDPSFQLSAEEARGHIKVAEDVWEQSTGRELFVYDPDARFTVNFVFDDRQATNNAEQSKREQLDREQQVNDEAIANLEALQYAYERQVEQYQQRTRTYERELETYNETVQRYNDQGGAPPESFAVLERQREVLATTRETLALEATDLNRIAAELADTSANLDERITAYNNRVTSYNAEFGEVREFTQGDYQGNLINIYTFETDVELERVLAHEFGHALGIGHVEGTSSIMYYLMTERADVPELSSFDTAAFLQVCGTGTEWEARMRGMIRNFIGRVT